MNFKLVAKYNMKNEIDIVENNIEQTIMQIKTRLRNKKLNKETIGKINKIIQFLETNEAKLYEKQRKVVVKYERNLVAGTEINSLLKEQNEIQAGIDTIYIQLKHILQITNKLIFIQPKIQNNEFQCMILSLPDISGFFNSRFI